MHAPEPLPRPVSADERLLTLDVLRGIALLGVLVANVWMWFSGTFFRFPEIGAELRRFTADAAAFHLVGVLVSGKAVSTFSFLFGLGFAVQMLRAEERGAPIAPLFRRRMAVLLGIGALHATLLWYGDILMPYALLGLLLLLFRARRDRTLFVWAGVLLVLVPLLMGSIPLVMHLAGVEIPPADTPEAARFRRETLAAFASGSPARAVPANLEMLKTFYLSPMAMYLLHVFGLFLLGLWAGRRRLFHDVEAHRAAFRRVAAWGLTVGLAASASAHALQAWMNADPAAVPPWAPLAGAVAGVLGVTPLAAGYVAAVTLLLRHDGWRRRLSAFAPVGRMALSNYLAQTVVCLLVFYGYGAGLIGRTGPAAALLVALAVFAAQVAWSPWWLARFHFGPVEWVWRSLTYGAAQPMRVRPAPAAPRVALLLLLSVGAAAPARAQHEHGHMGHEEEARVGWVPREVLERPVQLREGVGAVHDPVTTPSREAQAFYDQGVAYLHSYVWIEAARSFHQALRHDSALALAHVGLSRAWSGLEDSASARAALARAEALAPRASPREQRRVALRARQLDAMADPRSAEKLAAYRRALDEALAQDLDDAELWLLRGNVEEPLGAAGRGQRGTAAALAFYEGVLARVPGHFAAHHYLVHTNEHVKRFDRAVEHGEVYARLAWSVPHAHHMLAHDLMKVGRVADAVARFTRADSLEHAYYAAENVSRDLDWHHPHNQNLLAMSYQHQGRFREAERVLRRVGTMVPRMDDMEVLHHKDLPELLLAQGRAREALSAAEAMARGKSALTRAAGHAYRARALLALGRGAEAGRSVDAAERELAAAPAAYVAELITPGVVLARGEHLLRTGRGEEGRRVLRELLEKSRSATGPDAWIEALFRVEAVARAAREAGDWELAEAATRRLMEHDPAYAGSHHAAALLAEHRGDREGARKARAEAERLRAADGR